MEEKRAKIIDPEKIRMSPEEYRIREEEIWSLKLPKNLVKSLDCKVCGNKMHLMRMTDRVAFYVHRGVDLRMCSLLRPTTSFVNPMGKLLDEVAERHRQAVAVEASFGNEEREEKLRDELLEEIGTFDKDEAKKRSELENELK